MTERPDLMFDLGNCRPAHGAPGNPCAQCTEACGKAIYCNQLRGGYSIERAQRIIAELAAAHGKQSPPARKIPDPGRPW